MNSRSCGRRSSQSAAVTTRTKDSSGKKKQDSSSKVTTRTRNSLGKKKQDSSSKRNPATKKRNKSARRKAEESPSSLLLSGWNKVVESLAHQGSSTQCHPNDLPAEIWDRWIWYTDPQEAPVADCMLNQCQLIGLLICRYRAAKFDARPGQVPFSSVQLRIVDREICKMSLRELRDTLSNATLQWAREVQSKENIKIAMEFLDMCFHRFGEFCWASWPVSDDASECNPIADDVSNIEFVESNQTQQITFACMRNFLNTFLVLYRLLSWQAQSQSNTTDGIIPEGMSEDDVSHGDVIMEEVTIEKHHVQASLDSFYKLGMFYDLMPAGRLNYMHNFSGLYNCVSQPTYFHNPNYERKVQISLQDIRGGKHDVHTLPALMQMYPEIILLYEDDDIQGRMKISRNNLMMKPTSPFMWAWMMTAAKRIYLIRWNSEDGTHLVFYNSKDPNIISLLQRYYLPWHVKHSQVHQQQHQMSTSISSAVLNQTSRQNQIMTYFKMYFAKKN
jgi:hypothetical protein